EHGSYSVIDFREEFEYGVTDNFQLAIYLNHHYVHANDDVPAEDPAHPGNRLRGAYETGGEDVHAGHNPATTFDSYHFESVSLEGIYRLLSPYKDPFGLALYFEPTIGPDVRELEAKIIVQKNFLADRLVWAANLTFAPEWRRKTGNPSLKADDPESRSRWDKSIEVEFTTGLAYRVAQNWFVGLEFRNVNEFEGHSLAH